MVNLNISPSMLFSDTYDEGNQRVAASNVMVIVVLSVIVILFYLRVEIAIQFCRPFQHLDF